MKPRKLIIILVVVTLSVLLLTILFTKKTSIPNQSQAKIQISATFYPLAEFARQVGGELVIVSTVVPPGIEPHEFEPKPQDITSLLSSDLIIYNGAGFEPWIDKTISDLPKNQVKAINISQGIELIESSDEESPLDPHIWLDPILAQQIVDKIASELQIMDPQNSNQYIQNASQYKLQLQALDQKYQAMMPTCTSRDVITSHNAFGYLAARYNFNVTSIAGISPEEEPSSQQLAGIVDTAQAKNIKYIFFESLVSPRLSDTIAQEVGASTLVFNPLEGLTDEEVANNENYLTIQNKNLESLRTALQCQ
jgi:zinc transport system substrate-binding protein